MTTNSGLSLTSAAYDIKARLGAGLPPVTVPEFKVPRTFEDNHKTDATSAFGMPDPGLRTPYVQQWSFGIQQEIKGNIVEIRYVGNHGVKAFRAFDYNQVVIRENGFLDDFNRALNNGKLALARTGVFNPAYNPAIPGSQPLTVFQQLAGGGNLNTATVRNYIQTGQVGELANYYQTRGMRGSLSFYRNPFALGTNVLNNHSNLSYNALQVDVRRRLSRSLQIQGNYTFSKALSDAAGDGQTRFEAFLDINNPKIERARTPFDLTHSIKANGVYDLPIGSGHRLSWQPVDGWLLNGWSVSGIMTWQSGSPFSVLSGRSTLNRSARSGVNTATSTVAKPELDRLFQVRQTGSGPYFVAASAINPKDGRAVAPDGEAPFAGQIFLHPEAGSVGALQRRMFSGPWVFNLDFGVQKRFSIKEHQSVELRMESTNVLNHPSWYVGDQTISSTQFGRITSTMYGSRIIQLGLRYLF